VTLTRPIRVSSSRVRVVTTLAALTHLLGCASQGPSPVEAERIERLEQTQAGIAARVEEVAVKASVAVEDMAAVKGELGLAARDVSGLKSTVELVSRKVDQSQRTTINDVWPWLLTGLAVFTVGVLGALRWLRLKIEESSYLTQKPIWEERKRNGSAHVQGAWSAEHASTKEGGGVPRPPVVNAAGAGNDVEMESKVEFPMGRCGLVDFGDTGEGPLHGQGDCRCPTANAPGGLCGPPQAPRTEVHDVVPQRSEFGLGTGEDDSRRAL